MSDQPILVHYAVSIPYVLRLIGRKNPQSANSFVQQMQAELTRRLADHAVTLEISTNNLTAHTVDVQIESGTDSDIPSALQTAATTAWDDAVHSVILNHWL